jgi:hypothetical protein
LANFRFGRASDPDIASPNGQSQFDQILHISNGSINQNGDSAAHLDLLFARNPPA